jgi:putative transposase
MANLGHRLSDQTLGNILRRHDIPPAPKRKLTTSWKDFIRAHMALLAATHFFTVEVLTLKGLVCFAERGSIWTSRPKGALSLWKTQRHSQ